MLKNDEFKIFYYSKLLQSYLYNDEIYKKVNQGCYDLYIFDQYFIAILINFINDYILIDCPYQDLDVKPKLSELVNYIRINADYKDKDTKIKYYEIFNNLIVNLNKLNYEVTYIEDWILSELIARTEIKLKQTISYDQYYKYEEFVKKSLGYDFIYLTYLSDEIDEIAFNDNIELLANDEFYFASLNDFILNCPILLNNTTFLNRVKKILEYNHHHIERTNSLKTRKFIKKQIKKHIKTLDNF